VKFLAAILISMASLAALPAQAGFRSPESLVRNVYAYYGKGSADLSKRLPRSAEIAEQFFDRNLRSAWIAPRDAPYDFLVQSPSWKIGPVSTKILRTEFDKTCVTATFDNNGKAAIRLGNTRTGVKALAPWHACRAPHRLLGVERRMAGDVVE